MIGDLFRTGRRPEFSTFVALGDSFTAGNGCEPQVRWPDLVAAELRSSNPGLNYFNLAQDGAASADVMLQLPAAIDHRPDLVTLVCGANDILLSLRPDVSTFVGRFELMLDRLKRSLPKALILTSTYPEGLRLDGIGPRTQARVNAGMTELNRAISSTAASRGVACLDVVDHPGIQDPENLDPDGLHPSAAGHRHAAIEFRKAIENR